MPAWVSIRLLAPLLATVLALSAIAVEYLTLSKRLTEREAESAQQNLRFSALQAQGAVERELRHGDSEILQQIIAQLNFQPMMTEAIILDDNNQALMGSRMIRVGAGLAELGLEGIAADLAAVRQMHAGRVIAGAHPNSLLALYPVNLGSAVDASELRNTPGMLLIAFDYADRVNAIQSDILSATAKSAAGIVLMVLLIALAVHWGITRRVMRIVHTAERYLAGEFHSRVRLRGRDEIGIIGQSFDQVADAAEVAKAAMRDLNTSLEQRVEQRTTELQARRAELRAILDTAADAVIAIDDNAQIVEFNPAAERIFGWSAEQVMGRNVNSLMPKSDAAKHDTYVKHFRHTGQARIFGQDRELLGLRRDGSQFPLELTVNATVIEGKRLLIGVGRDISARKQSEAALADAQQALMQAENMAALGNLVAGVAHEINTPVGIGVTAASHLREVSETFEKDYRAGNMRRSGLEEFLLACRQSSGIIETNLLRASELIRSFKQVAVDQTGGDIREFQLAEYLHEILLSLRPKLKKRPITIEQQVPEELRVSLQAGALSQIVTNLVMNSLVHGFDDTSPGCIRISAQLLGQRLQLHYLDDGKGMDEKTVRHIFDPFFTTKRGSGGSGLGMHITYNLVTNVLGGNIACESSLGQGVNFEIGLPAQQQPAIGERN